MYDDTLVLESRSRLLTIPMESEVKLETSRGRQSNEGKGAGFGLLSGAVAGVVLGIAAYEGPDPGPAREATLFNNKSGLVLAGGILLGSVGAFVGATLGAGIRTEKWESAPADRFQVGPLPQLGGLALAASLRF